MEPISRIPGSPASPQQAPPAAPRDRIREWASRGKQAAVAMVLVGSTLFAGPVPVASAESSPDPVRAMVAAPGSAVSSEAERALGARLAVEYAGAVPAADVESLVRRVSRRLSKQASPPERLVQTTEAICRRALTDYLARGVLLPAA